MELGELWAIFGPGVAGAVFGAGWWFWVDAVICSSVNVSFVHYLPGTSCFTFFSSINLSASFLISYYQCLYGSSLLLFIYLGIFASIAALMFNCVRKEDIDYSPYDEGEWRLAISFPYLF